MRRLFWTHFFWTFLKTINALRDLLYITKTTGLMMFAKISLFIPRLVQSS